MMNMAKKMIIHSDAAGMFFDLVKQNIFVKKYFILLLVCLTALASANAQPVPDFVQDSILQTGKAIAQHRKAAALAMQTISGKVKLQEAELSGYITYFRNGTFVTAFYDGDIDSASVKYTTVTPESLNKNEVQFAAKTRQPSSLEKNLISVREKVYEDLSYDTSFYTFYENLGFELVTLERKYGFQAYLMPTSKETGVILFGNDYLLIFDNALEQVRRIKLHEELTSVPVSVEAKGAQVTEMGSMHQHGEKDSPLITPTDVAAILLAKDIVQWDQHMVMSPKFLSIFYLDEKQLGFRENK